MDKYEARAFVCLVADTLKFDLFCMWANWTKINWRKIWRSSQTLYSEEKRNISEIKKYSVYLNDGGKK